MSGNRSAQFLEPADDKVCDDHLSLGPTPARVPVSSENGISVRISVFLGATSLAPLPVVFVQLALTPPPAARGGRGLQRALF